METPSSASTPRRTRTMAEARSETGRIFRLEVGADRLATLTFDSPGRKVNVFTRAALGELEQVIGEAASRPEIGCLILLSGKAGNFIAGADVEEIARVTDPLEAE